MCAAGEADELSQFTPAFLWLLRDFYLALEEDGRAVSPGEYLESALQPVKGAGRSVEAKNAVSSALSCTQPDCSTPSKQHCLRLRSTYGT